MATTIKKKDYRSDIVLTMHMTLNGETVNVPQHDFILRFFTENDARHYDCGRINGKFVNCATDDEDSTLLTCYIKNHGLGCGMLQCTYIDMLPNDGMENGVQRTFSVSGLNVELVDDDTQVVDLTEIIAAVEAATTAATSAASGANAAASAAASASTSARNAAASANQAASDANSAAAAAEQSQQKNIRNVNYIAAMGDGAANTVRITQNDGTIIEGDVFNGHKGDKGDKGDQGNSGYTGAAGELEVVNNFTDGGATAALSAEMGKRIAELSQIIATRQSVSPQSVLTESYVDSSGEIKASGTATTTVAYYPIDGNPLSVIIGKTANSATRVLSLAEDDTQTTGLVALTEKMGDGAAYAPSELLSYSPRYKYLVVCYNNSADNSIVLNKGAISFAQLASLLYLSREYSADFDDSDCLIDKKYINYTTGAEAASDYWQSTDFIEIPSDVQWYNYLATNVGNSQNSGFAFYDSNKQFISGTHHVSNIEYSGAIPDNARYVRFCRFKTQEASTTMSLYSVGALGFKAWLEAAVSRQDEVVQKLSKDITKTYTTDDCVINGKFIHYQNGDAMNNSSFICSDFIETFGKTIVVTSSWAAAGVSGFCFYGSEKQYISGHSVTQVTDAVYLIPENAKYLRFTSKPGETNTFTMSLSGVDGLIYLIEHIDTDKKEETKERHILMVGNSFTMHACEYLQTICNNLGVSNITLQYIYTSGASLKTYAESLSTTRSLTTAVDGGNPFGGGTLPNIFKGNWDIIVFQQASNDSPDYGTYSPYLRQLIDCALENCPNKDLQIMFNMTWAYSDDDGTMWQGILDANKQLRDDYGHIVRATIASGTAVANIRRSLDVSLSYDNHHLSPGVGQYVAGCILYTSLIMPYSGVSIYDDTTVIDVSGDSTAGAVSVTNENRLICQQAVMDAYIDPWSDYIKIVNNLTTNDATKVLSAAQGVVLNDKIDKATVLSFTGSSASNHPSVSGDIKGGFIPGHTYRFWVQNPDWDLTGLSSMSGYDKFNIRAYNNKNKSTSNADELRIMCIASSVLIGGDVLPYYDWTLPTEVSGTAVKEWYVCLYGRAASGTDVFVYAEDITYINEQCGDDNNFKTIELNDVVKKGVNSSGTVSSNSSYWLKVLPVNAGDTIIVKSKSATSIAAISYAATADAGSVTMLQMHVTNGGYYWARINSNGYAYICFSINTQALYKIVKETPYELVGVKRITQGTNVLEELVGSSYDDSSLWGKAYLTSDGSITSDSGYRYSKNYYRVIPGSYIQRFSFSSNAKIVIYDESKETVVGYLSSGNATSSTKFTIPSGGAYIRISVSKTNTPNTDTLTFVSQQEGDYYVDTEEPANVVAENIVTTIDNNMFSEKEYLDKTRWTITNEDGTNSIDNYGQDNVRYAYKLPNNVNKIHVRFDFQFTRPLIVASTADQALCQLSGYSCWRASMRQNAFNYNSNSSYIGRGALFCARVGSTVNSESLNYVYYKTNEGKVAYTIRLKDATSDNVLLFLTATAITIKLGDDVLETISVSTTDTLDDVIDAINSSEKLRATAYYTTGKTWGDTNYGNSNGIPIASLSYVPICLSHDEDWHTFEAILDLEAMTSACAYDGITLTANIAEPTNMTLYIGGRPSFETYKNTPIRVRNLHIGLNSFEDAELVQVLKVDNSTYYKQLISNSNPKVIIFEGHGIEVHRDSDTYSNYMGASTDRLRDLFTYAIGKGYKPITWEQFKDWKLRGVALPSKRCFTMMMDDFQIENYLNKNKRLPFEQFGVKPGLAIISDRQRSEEVIIDGTTYTLAEAFDAIDRAEWYATSHTYNHTVMTNVANSEFFNFTKQCIVSAQKLGIHDDILVYPTGSYKTATMLLMPISGFALGIYIASNQYVCKGSNNYYIPRVSVASTSTIQQIKGRIV